MRNEEKAWIERNEPNYRNNNLLSGRNTVPTGLQTRRGTAFTTQETPLTGYNGGVEMLFRFETTK